MRLVCPNCGAQYEVADGMIPAEGRDVQCSNCGHTWLAGVVAVPVVIAAPTPIEPAAQSPVRRPVTVPVPMPDPEPEAEPEPAPDPELEPAPAPAPEKGPEPIAQVAPDPEPAPTPQPVPEPQTRTSGEDDGTTTIAAMMATQRSNVSDEAATVLREEVARELAARQAEGRQTRIETQTELGLDAPSGRDEQRAEEARRRMARMRGEAAPPTTAPVTGAGTRRELLPDIEEINSSLRSAADRQRPELVISAAADDPDMRRGRRVGFTTVIFIFAILTLLYVFAGRIIAVIPQAEPVLSRYVAVVNDGRLWLDLKLQAILAGMQDAPPTPEVAPETAPEEAAPVIDTGPEQAAPPDVDSVPETPGE